MCLAPNKQPDQPTLPKSIQKQEMRKAATDKHKIGVWNCAGLSHERYQYLQGQGFDVLALLELHGSPVKWEGRKLIVSERPEEGDPASGVAIMLSPRMQKDVLAFGKVGSRIVWVRIKGKFHNYFIVAAYIPHAYRKEPPFREDTHELLSQTIQLAKSTDCVMVLTDANGRLQRGSEGVGKYCLHPRVDKSGELLHNLMMENDLVAASTFFRSKSKSKLSLGNASYIMAKSVESTQPPAQIDYILVSKRWFNSVTNCQVEWRHSIHRYGFRYDHGLISMDFRQRVQRPKLCTLKPDFSSLNDEDVKTEFDKSIKDSMEKKEKIEESSTSDLLKKLQESMKIAIDELPRIPRKRGKIRTNSEETKQLFRERESILHKLISRGVSRKSNIWRETKAEYNQSIFKACREDWRKHIYGILDNIEESIDKGDYKAVFQGVKKLTGKGKGSCRAPTRDAKGNLLADPKELAEAWRQFAVEKFSKTEAEVKRGDMPDLGDPLTRENDVPSDEDLEICLKALAKAKAVGVDGIPVEAYRASESAKAALFQLIREIWRKEIVPDTLTRGIFVPFYKNKGSSDDMSKYRFICLLNHAYKVLSCLVLRKMMKALEEFLPETQAGFRAKRSTSDNIYVLAKLIDFVIGEDAQMIATFIDFVAAFDTVSHHFLDQALAEAKVPDKCRAILRAIYESATAMVRVTNADGSYEFSNVFPVDRGVIQGDIVSPSCFTAALHLIRILYDVKGGTKMGDLSVDCLEYADDAALLDNLVELATERISTLEEGALTSADMVISRPKTEVMQIRRQEAPALVTVERIDELVESGDLKFKCDKCSAGFHNKLGLSIHKARWCGEERREIFERQYVVEKILDARGPPRTRFLKIKWEGYDLDEDEKLNWEPIRHLIGTAENEMEKFWLSRPDLNIESNIHDPTEHRCCFCNKFYKRAQDLKSHHTKGCDCKPQSTAMGTRTAKAVVRKEMKLKQADRESVFAGDHELKNVFDFTYLGHMFQANGEGDFAIETRCKKAKTTFGRLHEFWSCSTLPMKAKLRMYQCCVWSTVTYGNVAWKLTKKTCSTLRNWNAKNLAIITGKTVYDETKEPTMDLIRYLRALRLKWVGHVLRRGENFPARRAMMMEQQPYEEGSILENTPKHGSMAELIELAEDREKWRLEVNSLKPGSIANPETVVSVFTTSSALRRSARVAARGTENP